MANIQGLTEQEVKERRAQGEGNEVTLKTSRSYWQIIKKNVFNFVHLILFLIGAMFIAVGRPQDAISSAGLILVNALIGSFQEIRAKRQLDKIALLTRPKVTVLREGNERELDPAENRMRRMMELAVPASVLNMILGIAIFAVTYYLALNKIIEVSITPDQVAEFEQLIGFELQSAPMAQQVAAGYAARSTLTPFLSSSVSVSPNSSI